MPPAGMPPLCLPGSLGGREDVPQGPGGWGRNFMHQVGWSGNSVLFPLVI